MSPLSRWVVLRCCVAPQHGGACCVGVRCVVLCGVVCCDGLWPPPAGAGCVGVWPPSLWGVVCCVVSRCVAVCCVVLHCVVWRGGAVWPPSWWGVPRWCVAPLLFALCCVVLCGVALGVLCCMAVCCVWCCCVVSLVVGRAALRRGVFCCSALCVVVVCGPPHGGVCCGVGWPRSWWGCVALCFDVSRRVVVCCVVWCGGVWPPSCRGVLRGCVAPF